MPKRKRKIRYPEGTVKPKMRNYNQKGTLKKIAKRKKIATAIKNKFSGKKYNKYSAHKINLNGHKFDSKAELNYYEFLKANKIKFKVHPRYTVIPHTDYISKASGKKMSVRKHSYTPDFVLYKKDKNGKWKISEVDDIKGVSHIPSYDRLRMTLFTIKYKIPVTIVRIRGKHIHKRVLKRG